MNNKIFSNETLKGIGLNFLCLIAAFFVFFIFANFFICDIYGIPGDPRGKTDQIKPLIEIGNMFLLFIGIAQLIYIIPVFIFLKKKQKIDMGRGFVFGACFVFAISTCYFVFLAFKDMKWRNSEQSGTEKILQAICFNSLPENVGGKSRIVLKDNKIVFLDLKVKPDGQVIYKTGKMPDQYCCDFTEPIEFEVKDKKTVDLYHDGLTNFLTTYGKIKDYEVSVAFQYPERKSLEGYQGLLRLSFKNAIAEWDVDLVGKLSRCQENQQTQVKQK